MLLTAIIIKNILSISRREHQQSAPSPSLNFLPIETVRISLPELTIWQNGPEIFNPDNLTSRLSHDRKACELLVNAFLRETRPLIELLEDYARRNENALFIKLSHKIKGSAANVSAERISTIAEKLEREELDQETRIQMIELMKSEFENFCERVKKSGY